MASLGLVETLINYDDVKTYAEKAKKVYLRVLPEIVKDENKENIAPSKSLNKL